MKLFKDSRGFTIAFGFDVWQRRENANVISWNDPKTGAWEPLSTNQAGWNELPYLVDPEFVFESDGKVIAYQPGRCTVLTFTGSPFVWSFTTLMAELSLHRLRAA